jgi:hypothetical protein
VVKHNGISCWRYRMPEYILQGTGSNPDNWSATFRLFRSS